MIAKKSIMTGTVLLWLLSIAHALLIPQIDPSRSNSSISSIEKSYGFQVKKLHSEIPLGSVKDEENYIVVLKNGHSSTEYAAHEEWVSKKCFNKQKRSGIILRVKEKLWRQKERSLKTFNLGSLKGYAGKLPKEILYSLQKSDMVDFIEKDKQVFLAEAKVQYGVPWGLERISHRFQPSPKLEEYTYHKSAGEGVTVYVIDTGVDKDNPEFEGRVTSTLQFGVNKGAVHNWEHGTHVAGIIGSKTFGVSKKVTLVSLGIFDEVGHAHVSSMIMAIQHVIKAHRRRLMARDPSYRGAVINVLLGCLPSEALEEAIRAAFNAGIPVVVSAGNFFDDACKLSPSRSKYAITVGATTSTDEFSDFSNWGVCVDLLAPGELIESVSIKPESSAIKSGTSMAAPHVAGVLAIMLSLQPPIDSEFSTGKLVSAKRVKSNLLKFATLGAIKDVPASTPNRFLFNGGDEGLDRFWNQ